LEEDFAHGLPHGIDGNTNRLADVANTVKPLSTTDLVHNERPQSRQPKFVAIEKWLEEESHEEPWSTSSRIEK
jgi:hypothetical protein